MAYRSDVRIVTTKDGFKKLKEFCNEYINKIDRDDYNLINNLNVKEEKDNLVYFGWNEIKWPDYTDGSYVDAVVKGLYYLEDINISYIYCRLGENYDDYDERQYHADTDEYLTFPSIIREFNDNVFINNQERSNDELKKIYVITNNSILNDEIIYNVHGIATNEADAKRIFKEAVNIAKNEIDFDKLDAINVTSGIENYDKKWHYIETDNSFELYLDGEYNSNNYSIEIKEYDLDKIRSQEKNNINKITKKDIEYER